MMDADRWLEVRALAKDENGTLVDAEVDEATFFQIAVVDYREDGMGRATLHLKDAPDLAGAKRRAEEVVDWHDERGLDLGIDSENMPDEFMDHLNERIEAQQGMSGPR